MALYAEIYISSSAVVNFIASLTGNSPILIIMYHIEITPESYKLMYEQTKKIIKPTRYTIFIQFYKNQYLLNIKSAQKLSDAKDRMDSKYFVLRIA